MSDDIRLIHGACEDVLATLPAGSVDSIVTDPPYGIRFMSAKWDYDVPTVAQWGACLRVLKPGGHLLSFAGTRTQHRMAVRIEDAGFEIRDMIAWVYGSGFPKSLDVSKAIDKMGGICTNWNPDAYEEMIRRSGKTHSQVDEYLGIKSSSCYWARSDHRACSPLYEHYIRVREFLGFHDNFASIEAEVDRECRGRSSNGAGNGSVVGLGSVRSMETEFDITAPATPAAQQWSGWGTALKPAFEPITVARKPIVGTVADNVLRHGTGALNIDECRVEAVGGLSSGGRCVGSSPNPMNRDGDKPEDRDRSDEHNLGRWPANFIHDGSEEVVGLFPENRSGVAVQRNGGGQRIGGNGIYGGSHGLTREDTGFGDSGSAARFFYCAKSSKADRGQSNDWPTVKPTDLMRYLVRLVTPPGGLVADPWMGSGSTGKAAVLEGFRFLGIDKDEHAFEIAYKRVGGAKLSRHDPGEAPDRSEPIARRPIAKSKPARRNDAPMFAFAEEGVHL